MPQNTDHISSKALPRRKCCIQPCSLCSSTLLTLANQQRWFKNNQCVSPIWGWNTTLRYSPKKKMLPHKAPGCSFKSSGLRGDSDHTLGIQSSGFQIVFSGPYPSFRIWLESPIILELNLDPQGTIVVHVVGNVITVIDEWWFNSV